MNITENTLFPIPFVWHIIFGMLALLVFGMQFIRFRKAHYLILAIALPCTLLPYLSDSNALFYGVGICEFIALFLALISSMITNRNKNKPLPASETMESAKTETQQEEEKQA